MRALCFLTLVACGGPDVVGSWEGVCEIRTAYYDADYGMGFDIEDDDRGVLSGSGWLEDENGYSYEGGLEGERKGRDIEMEILFPETLGYELTARAEVEVKGDVMVGDCIIGVDDVSVREEFELERR